MANRVTRRIEEAKRIGKEIEIRSKLTHGTRRKVPKGHPLLDEVDKRHRGRLARVLDAAVSGAPLSPKVGDAFQAVAYTAAMVGVEPQRPLSTWTPTSHNATRIFASMVRHCYAKYAVPSWMDVTFEVAGNYPRDPFGAKDKIAYPVLFWLHVANGGSIKAFADEVRAQQGRGPLLTKKQAHLLLNSSYEEAFDFLAYQRAAQVLGMGGSKRLARAYALSRVASIIHAAQTEDFLTTVIQWLVANPMLDMAQVTPVTDYLAMRHRQDASFSMKGRSANRVFAEMEEWHKQTLKSKDMGGAVYLPCGLQSTTYGGVEDGVVTHYHAVELLSHKDLVAEGSKLRHCVASYGQSVADGSISVWSIRASHDEKPTYDGRRVATIEVRNDRKAVVQARGFANAVLVGNADRAMRHFAAQNGLAVTSC